MEVLVLAPKEKKENIDYGDCFIINDNGIVTVYDCGSDELAEQVLDYLKNRNITDKINVILSHNDEDHFNGIPKLIENGVVNSVTTLLLLKYKNLIIDKIDDKRVNNNSLANNIKDLYCNISSLEGKGLRDALDRNIVLSPNLKIVGPSLDYFIEAVAKQFTPNESNNINKSTIMNAISVQLEISFGDKKLLLTGDADFAAFDDKIRYYDAIQLPHHGNSDMAKLIFEKNAKRNEVIYIVFDNKGALINGGSSDLKTSGHIVKTTKNGAFLVTPELIGAKRKVALKNEIYPF